MMDLGTSISEVLGSFGHRGRLEENARNLLGVLGYRSDRIPVLGGKPHFLQLCEDKGFLSGKKRDTLVRDLADVHAVFQFTDEELSAQTDLFGQARFKEDRADSFLFLAVALVDNNYSRSQLADLTRTINRLFAMPTILLFRYQKATGDGVITISVVHRRPSLINPTADVLEKVTLVKDVCTQAPHRAHLDILASLSLNKLAQEGTISSVEHLHMAWERALDTEPLNKRFYKELFRWFERAVAEGRWSRDGFHQEREVIGCIMRILFVWFIKEKRLVANDWFERQRMTDLLVSFGRSDYYHAVLENLFFATLNVPRRERKWEMRGKVGRIDTRQWRYRHLIRDVGCFEALMGQTPFINGGLFDRIDEGAGEDCSGNDGSGSSASGGTGASLTEIGRQPSWESPVVPDSLFFDQEGLFALLGRYKFTVEENTPSEIEAALDPELLGSVFEHLLAAYNPETRDSVREQTASYYTPRNVVDYMVDEALVEVLGNTNGGHRTDHVTGTWRIRLRNLLDYEYDYEGVHEVFNLSERQAIIRQIAKLKVLDPAVGSGAFPMAALNKLTFVLRRLDPDNSAWKKLQQEKASGYARTSSETREGGRDLENRSIIDDTFERYSDDFGRKLYLIQNCIYGLDIQPVACQIAKLRFFISLAIEQEPNPEFSNLGIKPLPNLETRFVAADTLLKLRPPDNSQRSISNDEVDKREGALFANRERYFHADSREAKRECIETDRVLRRGLAVERKRLGFPSDTAERVARWDPYSHNDVATWFDAKYMFGIRAGFDVVIGNPPYIQLQKNGGKLRRRYEKVGYATFVGTGDIYQLFFERGCELLRPGGVLAYITSNSWLRAKYGERLREYVAAHHRPIRLIDMGKDVFGAVVDTCVLIIRAREKCGRFPGVDTDQDGGVFPPPKEGWGEVRPGCDAPWSILSDAEWRVMERMKAAGRPLKDWDDISIYYGIKTGYNTAFVVDTATRDRLVVEDPRSADILKPILRGRDIQRYRARWAGLWVIATLPSLNVDINEYPAVKRHLLLYGKQRLAQTGRVLPDGGKARKKTPHRWFELQDTCAYHGDFAKPKIFWMNMSPRGRFAYSADEIYCNNAAYFMTGGQLELLCAILNSHLVTWFVNRTATTTGTGLTSWHKCLVESIPVPSVPREEGGPIVETVAQLLDPMAFGSRTNAKSVENSLNRMIYTLYGLTDNEIALVAHSMRRMFSREFGV